MSDSLTLQSYPKINLALDILTPNIAGYHEITTVFHQLEEPFDEIVLENQKGICEVTCDNPTIPTDGNNTVLKAAFLLKEKLADPTYGVKIALTKKIPVRSGLGGGSSNAVATLKGLAKLWDVRCCSDRDKHEDPACMLREIANMIGMDCAFFFEGGTALGEHFGEKITQLPGLPAEVNCTIIDTGVKISSKNAYNVINPKSCGKDQAKTQELIAALHARDVQGILKNLHNDFEPFILDLYPELVTRKNRLEKKGETVLLCGSGGALVQIRYS